MRPLPTGGTIGVAAPASPAAVANCREVDPALEPAGSGAGHTAACILAG
jgi:hypothetical protein